MLLEQAAWSQLVECLLQFSFVDVLLQLLAVRVVSRVLANGSAFVDCPELKELYGQDHRPVRPQYRGGAVRVAGGRRDRLQRARQQPGHAAGLRALLAEGAPGRRRAGRAAAEARPCGLCAAVGRGAASAGARPVGGQRQGLRQGRLGGGSVAEGPRHRRAELVGQGRGHGGLRQGYIMGTVKTPIPSKGFSLVEAPDSGHEADVYVHSSVAPPEALQPGEVVAFRLHISPKGQPQASAPLWKLIGTPLDESPAQLGEFVGQFNKMLPGGSGFVSCPALKEEYGRDTYLGCRRMSTSPSSSGWAWSLGTSSPSPSSSPPTASPRCRLHVGGAAPPRLVGAARRRRGTGASRTPPGRSSSSIWPAGVGQRTWRRVQRGRLREAGRRFRGRREAFPCLRRSSGLDPNGWMPDNHVVGVVKHADEVRGLSYVHSPGSGFERETCSCTSPWRTPGL
ncbi:unnamed protein product [Prorocentrum cordatum]|uniref:CSD domain-containing protein n=1 Tax=Prorocentrum cordatum TaxID=2364126 RepID=A0ABN9UJE2_9DINO|nr:unnamed protein product [Polarella glacialis]